MQDFEKLGAFYLGKLYDLNQQQLQPDLLLYESKDLTTHGVCVGMTGSGKTGLCLSLLEEAAIDGIPAIAIDPKGDLGNLLLAFPDLAPSDFEPWVDSGEATRLGMTSAEYAEQTADRWRKGLADWGESPDRIRRFRDAVDLTIYTPGSNAGIPLTMLRSFAAPPAAVMSDADAFRESLASAVGGLLTLIGVEADPIRSREHILLSNILSHTWREGRSLDVTQLIREIQSPPFDKVGVMDLETIFPAKDRFELAMLLNNLLASPGFAAWMEGEPLDVQRLLHTAAGKPRLSIISIAHLSDAERMFFVTTLLNAVVAWMRTQTGTSSLRALLYMDEVFGYFPPTANPPSKIPMLTLMKQARAFGLGVMLATQNPVDLDYKGLSNAGTWFLGRLQTERDKARVLDGLEGVASSAGTKFDRGHLEAILSGLGNRVFLMNNVHEDQPVVFQSRWALSYLRGPLTREQIARLMADRKQIPVNRESVSPVPVSVARPDAASQRPVVPPGIDEAFLVATKDRRDHEQLCYRPALLGVARVHYAKSTFDLDEWETVARLACVPDEPPRDIWEQAQPLDLDSAEFESEPETSVPFGPLAHDWTVPKQYASWKTAFKNNLYRSCRRVVFECSSLNEKSRPSESAGDFRVRVKELGDARRDLEFEKLRAKYAPKLSSLKERIHRAEQKVEREKDQLKQQSLKTVVSIGTTLLGALFARKLGSAANVSRTASSMRSAGRISSEKGDIDRAEESLAALVQQLKDLEAEFQSETELLRGRWAPENLSIEEVLLAPRKADLTVERVALAWTPWFIDAVGIATPAW